MLNLVYTVLGVNSWSWHGEIESDDLTSCFQVMVELWMRMRHMWWYGGHYHEQLGFKRVACMSQLTIPDQAGMRNVSNGSVYPTSGPGLDPIKGSVQCLTRPETRPADCWRATTGPVPFSQQGLLGSVRLISSIVRFCVSGFTFMVPFRYGTINHN